MDTKQNENISPELDTSLLASLIVELNIARRNFASYPKDHPLISASLKKALTIYHRFIQENNETIIGVTRNSLMIKGVLLDKNNLIFRDFARVLFEHGIGALTLRSGLTSDELKIFSEILCLKREELLNRGGITKEWNKTAIVSLEMQPIRYDLFNVVDTSFTPMQDNRQLSQNLWELFARSLIQNSFTASPIAGGDGCGVVIPPTSSPGSGGSSDSTGDILVVDDEIDPRLLASILNRQMGDGSDGVSDGSAEFDSDHIAAEAMTIFMVLSQSIDCAETDLAVPYEKLAQFINALNPELRRKFLSSSFDVSSISSGAIAEEILPRISLEAIADTLDDVRRNRFEVQPSFMEIFETLRANAQQQQPPTLVKSDKLLEIQQKIRSIFLEGSFETIVSESYPKKLGRIISCEQDSFIDQKEISGLMESLDSHFVENQISEIIVRIMLLDSDPRQNAHLVNNLTEIFYYLLSTGDYYQLLYLINQCQAPEIHQEIREQLRQSYSSYDSLYEMLIGLTTWGKSRYDDVTRLIKAIGDPFIEVLLDRLALEETLSLRRFLMDRIVEFRGKAKAGILKRLTDRRWFVLRNLIILLRQLNDFTVLEHIRPLLNNPHPRVRQEALRTCLHFHDPAAERQILYDMDSPDHGVQLSAVYMADKSRSADVFKKLLAIMGKPGFKSIDCELKSAALTVLAEIGRVEALSDLSRLLSSRSLLHARALNKLKIEAIRSMSRYPFTAVHPILTKIAAGSGEVAQQAQLLLNTLTVKST